MKKNIFKDRPERILGALVCFVAGILLLIFLAFGKLGFYESDSTPFTRESSVIININSASEEELRQLDGISDVLAKRIVQYREENGAFDSVEDLERVEGIGPKKIESFRKYVTAE